MLSFSSISAISYAKDNCHPKLIESEQNYLISYGNAMNSEARRKTTPNAWYAYPIEIKDFKRVWGMNGQNYKATFLTLIQEKEAHINAVYYRISSQDIKRNDKRQGIYCRKEIPRSSISPLGINVLPKGKFWLYMQNKPNVQIPTDVYPILQSYIDVFIGGCLDIEQTYQLNHYVKECINTTRYWPNEKGTQRWINDRVFPRRPFDSVPHVLIIDKLLAKHFDGYYEHPIR